MAHLTKIKVYYEDTDAGGVVYYANYLRYLERARTEFLSEQGINVTELHNLGYFFIVTHVDIYFKKPARLGDIIDVTTEIMEIKNASLTLKNLIVRDSTPLIEAYVTVAYIDKSGRPHRLPDEFKKLFFMKQSLKRTDI